MAASGDVSGCCHQVWGGGQGVLAPGTWPGMLLSTSQAQDGPTAKGPGVQNVSCAGPGRRGAGQSAEAVSPSCGAVLELWGDRRSSGCPEVGKLDVL